MKVIINLQGSTTNHYPVEINRKAVNWPKGQGSSTMNYWNPIVMRNKYNIYETNNTINRSDEAS